MIVRYLHEPIEGKPTEYEIREELDNTEEGEYHPIREPFRVVVFVMTLEGMNSINNKKMIK
jgi:hypothetical protein